MADFTEPRRHVARKPHGCSSCLGTIRPGESYLSQRGYDGGDAWTFKECGHCEAVRALWDPRDDNDLINNEGYLYWTENGASTVAELRAMAGWRHRWCLQSGARWPLPAK